MAGQHSVSCGLLWCFAPLGGALCAWLFGPDLVAPRPVVVGAGASETPWARCAACCRPGGSVSQLYISRLNMTLCKGAELPGRFAGRQLHSMRLLVVSVPLFRKVFRGVCGRLYSATILIFSPFITRSISWGARRAHVYSVSPSPSGDSAPARPRSCQTGRGFQTSFVSVSYSSKAFATRWCSRSYVFSNLRALSSASWDCGQKKASATCWSAARRGGGMVNQQASITPSKASSTPGRVAELPSLSALSADR